MALEAFDAQTIQKIAELGKQSAGALVEVTLKAPAGSVGVPQEIPAFLRTGASPEIIAPRSLIEQYRTAPERRKGVAKATTLASFAALVNRHKDDDSAIFAATAWPDPKLTAVIDYHAIDKTARLGQHRVEYSFPLTEEFRAWVKGDAKAMEQSDFALFLEDHAAELAVPKAPEPKPEKPAKASKSKTTAKTEG